LGLNIMFKKWKNICEKQPLFLSYNKTNKMHQILKFIFGIELYMFRTVSLSIIRSLAL